MINEIHKDAQARMAKSIDALRHTLVKVRTGRASTALVEHIRVNYYGSDVPLSQVASVAVADARSLTITRPIVFHYIRTPELLRAVAEETFAAFASGALRPIDPMELPLAEAAEAHRLLEARQSPGGIVLIP